MKIKRGIKGYQSYEYGHCYFCCQLTKKVINCYGRQGDEDTQTPPPPPKQPQTAWNEKATHAGQVLSLRSRSQY